MTRPLYALAAFLALPILALLMVAMFPVVLVAEVYLARDLRDAWAGTIDAYRPARGGRRG